LTDDTGKEPTMTTTTAVKPGAFFVRSWGYDQTNVTFYKVIAVTASGKSVRVQKWSSKRVERGVVPGDKPGTGDFLRDATGQVIRDEHGLPRYQDAPTRTRRLAGTATRPALGGEEYATLWDGQPEYETGHGAGH
jgi:hypothetical protein